MVIEEPDKSNMVIEKRWIGTGECQYKTADGRWWNPYYGGCIPTGCEVKELKE